MKTSSARRPLPVINLLEDPAVVRLAKHEVRKHFYSLAQLMVENRSSVARVLSGRDPGPWSAKDIRQVEKIVLRDVKDDRTVVGHLRVLRRLCECWVLRQDCEAPLPRTAILLRDLWNPHSRNLARALRLYREWGTWLDTIMTRYPNGDINNSTSGPIDSVVPVVASAILYGGIWNPASLVALIRAIPNLLPCTLASQNTIYLGLSLSPRGSAVPEFRAWQPDALTATILMRTPVTAVAGLLQPDPTSAFGQVPDDLIFRRLATEFEQFAQQPAQGVKTPTGLRALLKVAESVGYSQVPALLAAYACRRFLSHSLSLEQVQRISDEVWVYQPPVANTPIVQAVEASDASKNAQELQWPSWIDLLGGALDERTAAAVRKQLSTVLQSSVPLASRIADFAARAVQLRTLSSPRRSLEAFRERILLLAREAHLTWEDADPATLSDETIESGFRTTVERFDGCHASEAMRRRLRSGLREFHTYLRDCCGKPELKDRKILAPLPPGDRLDVNLLTFSEYREVLRRIEIRWPGRKNWSKRQIAKALMILGFRGGLRREEARLLKIRDLLLTGAQEVLVRPSAGHTLKSPSARRRVPLGLMAEEDELLILSNYWRFRVEDQGAQPNDFLFGNPRDCFRVISTGIFRQLNDIIADVTGSLWTEHPAHYHHCRASFASWGLTRLLLSDDVNVPGILASVEADWMRSGQTFQPEQIRRRTQPSRSDVFLLGALLGHRHPTTTMARYFRFSSELLRAYLDRSQIMRPAPGLVEKVCRIAAGTPRSLGTSEPLFTSALALLQKRAELDRMQSQRRPGIKSNRRSRWEISAWLKRSWELLSVVDTTDGSIENAARIVQMNVRDATLIVNRAIRLGSLRSANGEQRHRFEDADPTGEDASSAPQSVVPRRANEGHDLQIISEYSERLEQLYSVPLDRLVLQRGLDAYVNAIWLRQNCAVFHDPSADGEEARCYLDLLKRMGIELQHMRFASFDTSERSRWTTKWRNVLGFSQRFKLAPMRVPFGDNSSSNSWIAIEPAFGFGDDFRRGTGAYGFRFLMVMAYITFG